jgi:FkbM family methyltransferase
VPYRDVLVRLLDRPGGRGILGRLATSIIRRNSGEDLEVRYLNGLWTRRVGSHFLPDGRKFEYRYEDFSAWKGQFDRYLSDAEDYWFQHYHPNEGDVIVDVGAGRGEDTFAFSRAVGKTGRVIAVEAHPLSFAILRSFCRLNGLTNVTPLHLALMDKPGVVRITESKWSWLENAIDTSDGGVGSEVRADTLTRVCERETIERIAFLKVNIEGAERYALPGTAAVLPRVEQVCVACHDFLAAMGRGDDLRTRAFAEQFLSSQGFMVVSRRDDPRDHVRDHVFGTRAPGQSRAQ